jgi:hypothetical protein
MGIVLPRMKKLHSPFVKARRAIGLACLNADAPLTRAERAASCAIEFMMIVDGIGDGGVEFLDGFECFLDGR